MDKYDKDNKDYDVETPFAKEAAKITIKFTGKVLKLVGKGIKEAGGSAVNNYKENKANQLEAALSDFDEKYPDGIVLCSFDTSSSWDKKKLDELGIGSYVRNTNITKLAKILVDDSRELRYKIYGDYDNTIKRRFTIYGNDGNKIGSVNEHSKIFGYPYETVKIDGTKLGELNHKYSFSNTSFIVERVGSVFSGKHFIVYSIIGEMMEIKEVRGQDFIAVADITKMDECALLYTAIDLIWNPKPDYDDE